MWTVAIYQQSSKIQKKSQITFNEMDGKIIENKQLITDQSIKNNYEFNYNI